MVGVASGDRKVLGSNNTDLSLGTQCTVDASQPTLLGKAQF